MKTRFCLWSGDAMEWTSYIVLGFLFGGLFFGVAVYALLWAIKSGQSRDLEEGACVIFDEEEPLGVAMDRFPVKRARKPSQGEAAGAARSVNQS